MTAILLFICLIMMLVDTSVKLRKSDDRRIQAEISQ